MIIPIQDDNSNLLNTGTKVIGGAVADVQSVQTDKVLSIETKVVFQLFKVRHLL